MESREKTILILRWIQWILGAFSFGVCLAYFLTDVNFYLWISTMFRAQVALSGILHIYGYLAAISVSVKPQGPMIWAILDAIAILIAAAVAGTSQPALSEYCSKSSLTLYWSDANFAFVPLDQLASNDKSTLTEIIGSGYLQRACGLNAGVVAANGLLIILLTITAFLQCQQHLHGREERMRYVSPEEKFFRQQRQQQNHQRGWRQSLAAPFVRRNMSLDV